ncbi:hypothetical protein H8891_04495 [Paeniclostridium sp. NSJ-45]|uniref:Uncharacterized protein n=1 Tax=Paeniclostridium hominis TaxID=2764329 RepID=A0ABR7K1T1_9FIRM|nr:MULTISPECIES: hypothetical protein [Paeniclostridium]MBC6003052.1 hypothetical protein [Paeniclostridium hominis]
MQKAKKICYALTTILECLLLIGAYMVNYFTQSKMGMLRHVIHKNYVWEEKYPIANIINTTIITFIILMLIVLILYMKRRLMLKNIVTIMVITMIIFVLSFVGFMLMYSAEEIRAFYYMSFIIGITVLIQIIKTFISVLVCKK